MAMSSPRPGQISIIHHADDQSPTEFIATASNGDGEYGAHGVERRCDQTGKGAGQAKFGLQQWQHRRNPCRPAALQRSLTQAREPRCPSGFRRTSLAGVPGAQGQIQCPIHVRFSSACHRKTIRLECLDQRRGGQTGHSIRQVARSNLFDELQCFTDIGPCRVVVHDAKTE